MAHLPLSAQIELLPLLRNRYDEVGHYHQAEYQIEGLQVVLMFLWQAHHFEAVVESGSLGVEVVESGQFKDEPVVVLTDFQMSYFQDQI